MSISLLPMENLDEWENSGLITPPEIAFVSTPKDQLNGLAMVRRLKSEGQEFESGKSP